MKTYLGAALLLASLPFAAISEPQFKSVSGFVYFADKLNCTTDNPGGILALTLTCRYGLSNLSGARILSDRSQSAQVQTQVTNDISRKAGQLSVNMYSSETIDQNFSTNSSVDAKISALDSKTAELISSSMDDLGASVLGQMLTDEAIEKVKNDLLEELRAVIAVEVEKAMKEN